ncbi:hypothetical protein B0H11DRAFT_2225374 [Mycena galericulata]|nr:hypothetical protein B0H11DRAFT_2225374 [Mycena galericulata]
MGSSARSLVATFLGRLDTSAFPEGGMKEMRTSRMTEVQIMEKLKQVGPLYSKIKKVGASGNEYFAPILQLLKNYSASSRRHRPPPLFVALLGLPFDMLLNTKPHGGRRANEHDPAYAGPWMLVRHGLDRWA